MNKKITALATALAMTASLGVAPAITASAAPNASALKDNLMVAFDNVSTNGQFPASNGTIMTKETDTEKGDYILLSEVHANTKYEAIDDMLLEANITVDGSDSFSAVAASTSQFNVKVELDMSKVKVAYDDYTTLLSNIEVIYGPILGIDATTMLPNTKVKGLFTIKVTIPSGLAFADSTFTSTPLAGFKFADGSPIASVFTEKSRNFENNVLTIEIEVDKTKSNLDTYFNAGAQALVLEAPLKVTSTPTYTYTYSITGNMSGNTDMYSAAGLLLGKINYTAIQQANTSDSDAVSGDVVTLSETATLTVPSTGGGGGGGGSSIKPTATPSPSPTPTVSPEPTTEPTAKPTDSPSYVEPTMNPNPSAEPVPEDQQVSVDLDKNNNTKYIYGYPEGDVRPENNISRAEVAAIFYRLLTDESRAKVETEENNFTDVDKEVWYNKEVSTMTNAGVLTGYDDNTFKGDQHITRAELATIAARFSNLAYTGAETKFHDIADHWAQDYINLAAEIGWVNGYADGSFNPDEYISRAETITLINRVIERSQATTPEDYDIKWADNTTDKWYYHAVQKATNDIEIDVQ